MQTFLQNNFQNLAKYVDLNDSFVKSAIARVIAKKLRQNYFVTNFNLSLRLSNAFIDSNV